MATIRERRKADGSRVYDAASAIWNGGRQTTMHIGTVSTRAEAEELIRAWADSLELDRQIVRERKDQTPTEDGYRWHLVGQGNPHRSRQANRACWSDPTADIAIARADRWLAERRQAKAS